MKRIIGLLVAFAMVSVVFAGAAHALGQNVFVYSTGVTVEGDKLIAWVPARSNEIATDETGFNGNMAMIGGLNYDPGNYNTGWNTAAGDTTRTMICNAAGGVFIQDDALVNAMGTLDMGGPITLTAMVSPTALDLDGTNMQLTWADPGIPELMGYMIYRSNDGGSGAGGYTLIAGTSSDQAGFWWGNVVANLERADTFVPAATLTFNDVPGDGTWSYAIRYVFDGQIGGTDWGVPTQLHDATVGQPTVYTPTYSAYGNDEIIGGSSTAPDVTVVAAEAGNLLVANHNDQTLALGATISDAAYEGDLITGAEININGEGWMAMTAVNALDTDTEAFTYAYTATADAYPTGVINYDVRGTDAAGGPGPVTADSFTIVDTTNPDGSFLSAPGATAYIGSPINFIGSYEDFTAIDFTVANSYFEYEINAGAPTQVAWTNDSFAFGSYTNIISYLFATGGYVDTDVVTYRGVVEDSAGNAVTFGAGLVTLLDAPAGVQDPYPVYGYVYLYDGIQALGYTPMISTGGAAVTVWWVSTVTALPTSLATVTNAAGQFSVDILNYTDGGVVEITAAFEAPYGNNGYNSTLIDIVGVPGGVMENVVCGVPYEVVYNPLLPAIAIAAAPVGVTYEIRDRDGALAQGYFTHADGDMDFFSGDLLFVNDVAHPLTFDGTATATPGTYTATVTFGTGGLQYLNISEGGAAELNNFPTPWGAFTQSIAFATVDGWLDDYQNETIFIQAGAFIWNLDIGWNQICVPMDPTNDGVDPGTGAYFGAFDALREINAVTGDANCAIADRTGGNPSSYTTFDFGNVENGGNDFPMDYVHGYWVYSYVDMDVAVSAINVSVIGDNVATLAVGWNLMGFTHDQLSGGAMAGGWTAQPTADDFATGVIDANLDVPGADTQIIATWWDQTTQWYNSYVYTDTFPGMVGETQNWVYDTNYAYGYFLWSEGADVITFNVAY
jgi:hypothetical protein